MAAVVVQIVDGMGPDAWPFSDRIYVVTTGTYEQVHAWAVALQPDVPSPERHKGWFGSSTPPPGAPIVLPGYRVTYLFWD